MPQMVRNYVKSVFHKVVVTFLPSPVKTIKRMKTHHEPIQLCKNKGLQPTVQFPSTKLGLVLVGLAGFRLGFGNMLLDICEHLIG